MLNQLALALEHFLTNYGYIAIFVMMFVEEAGVPLPLPNEVALMYAGYLASRGDLNALWVSVVATLGAAGGSALLYAVARRGGRPLLRRFGRFIHLDEEKIDRAEHWVDRFGMISVPLARLTPGLRIYTTIIAGLLRVPYRIVIAAVVGASLVWSFFWVHLGYFLGENWEQGARVFERAGRWGIGVVVAVVAVVLLVRWLLRRRAGRHEPPDDDTSPPAPPRDRAPLAAREEAALTELERR